MSILIDRHGPYGHRVPGDLDELPLGRDARTRLAPLEAPDQGGAEMTPPLLMLDVDGVLLPFGKRRTRYALIPPRAGAPRNAFDWA